jgi:hypothetical protein
MARRQRDLKREQTWRKHVERQRTSGQTVRTYCNAHQLRETSFFFWRQEIAKRDREAAATSSPVPAFVPVAVIEPPTENRADAPIDIRLADGHRVRVRSGCDRSLLTDVLSLLLRSTSEGRPC